MILFVLHHSQRKIFVMKSNSKYKLALSYSFKINCNVFDFILQTNSCLIKARALGKGILGLLFCFLKTKSKLLPDETILVSVARNYPKNVVDECLTLHLQVLPFAE